MIPSETTSSFPMFSGEGACANIAASVAHAMSNTEWASADNSILPVLGLTFNRLSHVRETV